MGRYDNKVKGNGQQNKSTYISCPACILVCTGSCSSICIGGAMKLPMSNNSTSNK